jgi:hypothetical protein
MVCVDLPLSLLLPLLLQVCSLGEEAHLNTCFKHFIIFVQVGVGHVC